jgi:hypothetical protein
MSHWLAYARQWHPRFNCSWDAPPPFPPLMVQYQPSSWVASKGSVRVCVSSDMDRPPLRIVRKLIPLVEADGGEIASFPMDDLNWHIHETTVRRYNDTNFEVIVLYRDHAECLAYLLAQGLDVEDLDT